MTPTAIWQLIFVQARHRLRGDRGASLTEYALLLALIALVCFAAAAFLGQSTSNGFTTFNSSFVSAAGS